MLRTWPLLLFGLFLGDCSESPRDIVEGKVVVVEGTARDAQTKQGIAAVMILQEIEDQDDQLADVTDTDGTFSFGIGYMVPVEPSVYRFEVAGYETTRVAIPTDAVQEGEFLFRLEIELAPID